jgi:hypothetical protein
MLPLQPSKNLWIFCLHAWMCVWAGKRPTDKEQKLVMLQLVFIPARPDTRANRHKVFTGSAKTRA